MTGGKEETISGGGPGFIRASGGERAESSAEGGAEVGVPRGGGRGSEVGLGAEAHVVGGDDDGDVFGADGGCATENFLDGRVADGDASDGAVGAVDHDVAAEVGAAVFGGAGAVEAVGVVEAEGEVVEAVGVQAFDAVDAFGNLAVAFAEFGTEGAAPGGHGVDAGGVPARSGDFDEAFVLEDEDLQGVAGAFGESADFGAGGINAGDGLVNAAGGKAGADPVKDDVPAGATAFPPHAADAKEDDGQ
jgi:hypothetical protein